MVWTTTRDMEAFEEAAGAFLCSRPAEHTLLLTLVERLRHQGPSALGDLPAEFGWWTGRDGVSGAFLRTPPRGLILTRLPDAAHRPLAEAYRRDRSWPAGVFGPEAAALGFAGTWAGVTGAGWSMRRRERLYRLGRLLPPAVPPNGSGRAAREADRALLVEWWAEFDRELARPHQHDPGRAVEERLSYGGLTLWEDGGQPVALAGLSRTAAGMARIGPVFTPRRLRGRGYASAVTATVSRSALAAGVRDVLLFTDLANPTSNGLYQRIGYRKVADYAEVDFSSGAGA
ncbi:GNAT family N-acetyltransferase [Streptomyces sp. WMMB 322]|uniref:GNAT family N-acetyltransferase n=1 Tax=Streptomyces sp. WMMB 322 TaxID=1286821 RepID=UPI0006E4556F|nr:GNAT family N-acetyltransferase [Streptomyces sp. WMMB 322]SCK22734.1 FR47-like protein [Streptomyces sp. WMMB 322]